MRFSFVAAFAAFALAACGQQQQSGTATTSAQPQQNGALVLSQTQNLPDWLFILRTTDGGTIHFNQRTITRANGIADIWLQVHYGHQQIYQAAASDRLNIIHYELERIHYRFNCTDEKFVIVERQIMGSGETVVARDEPQQIWRATPETGAARYVLPIACRGS
ncbi:MAG TPA: surface-adhesin E family protein [Caulobacterales bacterium]|nr:surface-adhesin E family protein [Caulobacterales bacterium]